MDQRAIKILFDTYWTSTGWRPETDRHVSDDDLKFAKDAGVMFDSIYLNHDQLVQKAIHARYLLDKKDVVDAFIASFSLRRLDFRSALGSYAVLRNFPQHDFMPTMGGKWCSICGAYNAAISAKEDLNVLNFERYKWGGVRHLQPLYAAMDLEIFAKNSPIQPKAEDMVILRELFKQIELAPNEITSANLGNVFPKTLKSSKAERDVIVAILGLCGVLETSAHHGFLTSFIPAKEREIPQRRFVNMDYPACWWTRTDGINQKALQFWFGHVI